MKKILIPTSEDVEGNGEFIAKIPKRKSFGWALIPHLLHNQQMSDMWPPVVPEVEHG
jgi:hypothetical protein